MKIPDQLASNLSLDSRIRQLLPIIINVCYIGLYSNSKITWLFCIVLDTAEVKGRLIDPFFNKISRTMKQIENPVQERGRMLIFINLVTYRSVTHSVYCTYYLVLRHGWRSYVIVRSVILSVSRIIHDRGDGRRQNGRHEQWVTL